ncbi:C25 family cysteine peptidase, partial [Arthrospira platensis SPKY1]|nr:C25 family cysteine peptidase [Arthrospira platensis SPKY1]
VPTYGFPGADNLIAARYEKNHPGIAIGRIAARNHEEIKTYLNKVKRYDSYRSSSQNLDDRLWMKKVIHLVGGSDPSEVESIRTLMGLMENSLKNGKFAPNVVTYERTSGTAQETVSEKIISDIEEGAAIVTFFGHSS